MSKVKSTHLKQFNFVHLLFWLVPGFILNWLLRNDLWWTNFMSWFAIVLTVGTMWGASRTEVKQDEAVNSE